MPGKLNGKTALVTGGTRGIGEAIARRLAADGADVAISYANSSGKAESLAKELQARGVRAFAVKADQADAAQVQALVETVAERFGRLDILVNNAGVAIYGSVDQPIDARNLAHLFAVNVAGVAAAVRAAAPRMTEGGRIVSIGSCLGSLVPYSGLSDYSATKAAVAGYTKGWARDLGPRGITVNVVEPGPIDTDMNPDQGEGAEKQKQATALGRYGRAEEVAAAVAFLASPDASYITGATLAVDGGHNA